MQGIYSDLTCTSRIILHSVICLLLVGVGGGSHNCSTMCFGPCYHADGGLTSLSTSKDGSQVVVAGRNGETMSKDHFLNYSRTSSPPTPLPDIYPPCGHIIIMATLICPVMVRLLSVMGSS